MTKIKLFNKIANVGLECFDDKYSISDDCASPEGVLVRSAKLNDMQFENNLLAIARAGAGVNNIPVDRCAQSGIVVFNTPGANANAVKELGLAALMLASRDIVDGIAWANTLKGDDVAKQVEKGKSNFAGQEVKGKTLGVIGLGAIGAMIANDASAIGMRVMGEDPYISVQHAWSLSRRVKCAEGLDSILENADYITIHVPLMEQTRNYLGKEEFAKMKKGVRIINLSRNGLVDDDALLEAIDAGIVAKYVTDFPTEKLLNKKGIIAIPHLGASTGESEENCAVMASEQLKEYIENGNIKNSVNFPNCDMGPVQNSRICIFNENIPNMLGQITSVMADESINIVELINKSKGDYAYTMLDIETKPSDALIEKIANLDGVIRIRVI